MGSQLQFVLIFLDYYFIRRQRTQKIKTCANQSMYLVVQLSFDHLYTGSERRNYIVLNNLYVHFEQNGLVLIFERKFICA